MNRKLKTCWCVERNFLYYTQFPNVTRTWAAIEQQHFHDYIKDSKTFRVDLCEQICGDLHAFHSMISLHVEKKQSLGLMTLISIESITESKIYFIDLCGCGCTINPNWCRMLNIKHRWTQIVDKTLLLLKCIHTNISYNINFSDWKIFIQQLSITSSGRKTHF